MVALKTLIFSILVPGTVAGVIPWLLLQGPSGLALMIPSVWMVGIQPVTGWLVSISTTHRITTYFYDSILSAAKNC
jgi:hypothetical protein